jgi:hypothetical protein
MLSAMLGAMSIMMLPLIYLPWSIETILFVSHRQGGQGKYSQVLLSPTVSLTNVANVNHPLLGVVYHLAKQ